MFTYQDYLKLRTQATEEVNKLKPLGLTGWHQAYNHTLDTLVQEALYKQSQAPDEAKEPAPVLVEDVKVQPKLVCSTRVAKGLWVRNPFFKRYIDVWDDGEYSPLSATSALQLKGVWGFVHRVLNSKASLLRHQEFVKQDNAAGYKMLSLRNPFYFAREERRVEAEVGSLSVVSYGFNYLEERVAGHCVEEYTIAYDSTNTRPKVLWQGRSDRRVSSGTSSYNLTYTHVLEDLLKSYEKDGILRFEVK